jgi:DNA primase large subunit
MQKISIHEFYKQDLCINHPFHEEELIDSVDAYIEAFEYEDITEDDIEIAKEIKVFTKDYFEISFDRLWNYLNDFAEDNYCLIHSGHEVMGEELVEKFVKDFNEQQYYFIDGDYVGTIDLSEELKRASKER